MSLRNSLFLFLSLSLSRSSSSFLNTKLCDVLLQNFLVEHSPFLTSILFSQLLTFYFSLLDTKKKTLFSFLLPLLLLSSSSSSSLFFTSSFLTLPFDLPSHIFMSFRPFTKERHELRIGQSRQRNVLERERKSIRERRKYQREREREGERGRGRE